MGTFESSDVKQSKYSFISAIYIYWFKIIINVNENIIQIKKTYVFRLFGLFLIILLNTLI